jgi:hypothetical protein
MKVEQITILLENQLGRLADVASILAAAGVNIRALSLADSCEHVVSLVSHAEARHLQEHRRQRRRATLEARKVVRWEHLKQRLRQRWRKRWPG